MDKLDTVGIEVVTLTNLTIEDTDSSSSDNDSVRPTSQAAARPQRRRKRRSGAARTPPGNSKPAQIPTASATPKRQPARAQAAANTANAGQKKGRKTKKATKVNVAPLVEREERGLGARPIVDDVSEVGDVKTTSIYDEAAQYISSSVLLYVFFIVAQSLMCLLCLFLASSPRPPRVRRRNQT